jgi:hypothetical protein
MKKLHFFHELPQPVSAPHFSVAAAATFSHDEEAGLSASNSLRKRFGKMPQTDALL